MRAKGWLFLGVWLTACRQLMPCFLNSHVVKYCPYCDLSTYSSTSILVSVAPCRSLSLILLVSLHMPFLISQTLSSCPSPFLPPPAPSHNLTCPLLPPSYKNRCCYQTPPPPPSRAADTAGGNEYAQQLYIHTVHIGPRKKKSCSVSGVASHTKPYQHTPGKTLRSRLQKVDATSTVQACSDSTCERCTLTDPYCSTEAAIDTGHQHNRAPTYLGR